MFGNLLVVTGVIAVFWVIVFIVYIFSSRQQRSIANELDALEKKLDAESENLGV